ncbi:hypothetical protein NLI96_g8992 [Meripilus lineatus]|uniref:Uncharacterized protein n=1 Tax=Meripilus lineatus TaxID=2056292 RepID=A0AAD5UYK7_9APHY|nr:hypothetical protein NLI96_g8992 [Physisporinus lineatus]
MQRQPTTAAPPSLSSVLPMDQITRKRSSLLSSAPHTPTTGNLPLPLFPTNKNRYSTDSWDSSNCSAIDETEWEWKPEQTRLLTLDALPAHLLTPFNGPIPPSNLLDKIAKGVIKAKGPLDWPHSLRSTRAKIVELARERAKECTDGDTSDTIAEEESNGSDVPLQQTTNTGPKRPLYRQSSMDFMQTAKIDIKDNGNIRRCVHFSLIFPPRSPLADGPESLSRRLQRTDRILTSPTYHPYALPSRPSSPAPFAFTKRGTPSLNPSTPSSTTLNSSISSSRSCRLQRSISSLSSASDQFSLSSVEHKMRRIKRAETFSVSEAFARPLKRAPSFSASSRGSMESVAMSIDFNARDSDVTSDEEEKIRYRRKTKKARTKATSPPPTRIPLTPSKPGRLSTPTNVTPSATPISKATPTNRDSRSSAVKASAKPRANLKRNPSILGPELPNPQPNLEPPASIRAAYSPYPKPFKVVRSPSQVPESPYSLTNVPPTTPQTQPTRTLKRTKASASLNRRAPARKISFGSLAPPVEEPVVGGAGLGLGSAFQLR